MRRVTRAATWDTETHDKLRWRHANQDPAFADSGLDWPSPLCEEGKIIGSEVEGRTVKSPAVNLDTE